MSHALLIYSLKSFPSTSPEGVCLKKGEDSSGSQPQRREPRAALHRGGWSRAGNNLTETFRDRGKIKGYCIVILTLVQSVLRSAGVLRVLLGENMK